MNILDIRSRLNELPFRSGQRQILIGRLSDRFELTPVELGSDEDEDPQAEQTAAAIEQYLTQLRDELSPHGLQLRREDDDPDELYVVQHLKLQSEVDLSWLGEAMSWSARIMAVGLEMVLPVVGGMWLDARLGTGFLAIVGICIGLPIGLWHILLFTRRSSRVNRHHPNDV